MPSNMTLTNIDFYLILKCIKYQATMTKITYKHKYKGKCTKKDDLLFKYAEYKHSTVMLYLYKNTKAQLTNTPQIPLDEIKKEFKRIKTEERQSLEDFKQQSFKKYLYPKIKKPLVYISIVGTIGYFISQIILIYMFGLVKGIQYNNFPFLLFWMFFILGDICTILEYTKYRKEIK